MIPNPAGVPSARTPSLWDLDCRTVLVTPARAAHNPSTGVRGTIRVVQDESAAGEPRVEIVLRYPEMFVQQRRERVIPLTPGQVQQLLACADRDHYEFKYDGELGPTEPGA